MNAPGQTAILPAITRCDHCGTIAAEFVCHICKEPRPAYERLVAALRSKPALQEAA